MPDFIFIISCIEEEIYRHVIFYHFLPSLSTQLFIQDYILLQKYILRNNNKPILFLKSCS